MRLYFVRHGESTLNASMVHQHPEVALSKLGLQQAKFVARRFSTIQVDVILSSHYTRASQTAEAMSKVVKKKVEYVKLLRELKRPTEIQGKRYDDAEAVRIKKIIREHEEDSNYHYSDEENFFDFKKRGVEFLTYVLTRSEKNIAVVSHGITIRLIVGLMLFGFDELTRVRHLHLSDFLKLSNTGLTVCEKNQSDKWNLVTWNDHAHLGEFTPDMSHV